MRTRETAAANRPSWPDAGGRPLVFLLDASSGFERRLLEGWVLRARPDAVAPADVQVATIPASRRRRRWNTAPDRLLEAVLHREADPLLVPLRVVWRVGERHGRRAVRLKDLFTLGDPRDPDALRQRWLYLRFPDRCWVVAGEPATVSDLQARWERANTTRSLMDFVVLQAHLALEREERRVRGARYKVPRLIHEQILARPTFRAGLIDLARETGRPVAAVSAQASRYLREIAATHSPYVIDLVAHLIRLLVSQGYQGIDYDRGELEAVYSHADRYPLVFLPSHKSNLDHPALQLVLWENDRPPNHTAGGINMSFFPVGPLIRRTGVFFIRRSFKDNKPYKFVLRQYLSYLLEKRFPLEWYIEGGRSRSGKLRAPRFGLLAYVADAYRHGASDDVVLVPVSIAYDQIQEVGGYAAEQRGGSKRTESFGALVEFVRKLRRRYGRIYVRFGEPISMAEALGPIDGAETHHAEVSLAVQKLAFDVCVGINDVTPITPASLVTLALLGTGARALSVDELVLALEDFLEYVRARSLPTTVELELDKPEGVQRAVEELVENDVVTSFTGGPEPVYMITEDQALQAAYYRNSIIHFFVDGAIAELALLRAAETGLADPTDEFWREALRLRDQLKFEFFFARKDDFRKQLEEDLAQRDPEWASRLAAGGDQVRRVLLSLAPYRAHWVLRPFYEAYQVVGDSLEGMEADEAFDRKQFLSRCLGLGKQYYLQRRITTPEAVSATLFETALNLAANRGLLLPGRDGLVADRHAFAAEIRDVLTRIDAMEALAQARRAGLIE